VSQNASNGVVPDEVDLTGAVREEVVCSRKFRGQMRAISEDDVDNEMVLRMRYQKRGTWRGETFGF